MPTYALCVQTWDGPGPYPAVVVPITLHPHSGAQAFEFAGTALAPGGGSVLLELYEMAGGTTLATATGTLVPGVRTTLVVGVGSCSLPPGPYTLAIRCAGVPVLPEPADCYSIKVVELDEDPAYPKEEPQGVAAAKRGKVKRPKAPPRKVPPKKTGGGPSRRPRSAPRKGRPRRAGG
jgi:hypothetical protein